MDHTPPIDAGPLPPDGIATGYPANRRDPRKVEFEANKAMAAKDYKLARELADQR